MERWASNFQHLAVLMSIVRPWNENLPTAQELKTRKIHFPYNNACNLEISIIRDRSEMEEEQHDR